MIRRGEVYWTDFSGARGAEARKTRPALVVSNDGHNAHMATVTVAPLSSEAVRRTPFEVHLPPGLIGDGRACRVKTHQLKSVDKARLRRRAGNLPEEWMSAVDAALRIHLDL